MHAEVSAEAFRAIREERDALREELRQLRREIAPPHVFPPEWKLTRCESRLLSAVLAASPRPATHNRVLAAIYKGNEPPQAVGCVKAFASRLRRKLGALGMKNAIHSAPRVGFWITAADADAIRSASQFPILPSQEQAA